MRNVSFIMMVVFILGSSNFVFSDSTGTNGTTTHVMVSISSGDESDRDRLSFCIEKELRQFEDISLAGDTPDWKLDIIASRAPVKGSVDEDYVFSVVSLKRDGAKGYVLEGHELMVGYPNLQGGCRNIVRLFIEKYLHKKSEKRY